MPTYPAPSPSPDHHDLLHYCRTIRDPLYKYIHITHLENEILKTRAFQRLDRVSQMHSVHLVYPNARYSRKCHSLGAMHLIHRAFTSILYKQHRLLRESVPPLFFKEPISSKVEGIDDLNKFWHLDAPPGPKNLTWVAQGVRLAGMLHDLGHAPFSHLFESICREADVRFKHEEMSRQIIEAILLPEVKKKGLDEEMADFVCDILSDNVIIDGKRLHFLHELISGPINCDKLDYLVRDAYHAGTPEYGQVDVDRIIDSFLVEDNHLKIHGSNLDCVMDYFHSVFYMYNAVYFHKTCRLFDLAIGEALKEQKDFLKKFKNPWELLKYDEASFISKIKSNFRKKSEPYLAIEKFLNREKPLKLVARKKFNLRLEWMTAPGLEPHDSPPELEKLESILEEEEGRGDYKITVDTGAKSRPVGITPKKILKWLEEPKIFDTITGKFKKFVEVSSIDYHYLEQMTIPVAVFIPREFFLSLPKQEFERLKSSVNDILNRELNRIKKKYEEEVKKRTEEELIKAGILSNQV